MKKFEDLSEEIKEATRKFYHAHSIQWNIFVKTNKLEAADKKLCEAERNKISNHDNKLIVYIIISKIIV